MRKVAETRFPDGVALSYSRDMIKLIRELWDVVKRLFDSSIAEQVRAYKTRVDAAETRNDGPLDVIRQAIETMRALATPIFSADNVLNIATRFVNGVNSFNKNNIQQQGRVVGIDPTQNEPWLDEFMRVSVSENTSYITAIKDDYFLKIESIIYNGVKRGTSEKEMKKELMRQVGMSEKRAKFIARDQAGSILGQLTKERHVAMGVEKFIWRTSKDERVRATHKAHENKVYEYANPPKEGLPGEDYRCRCTATPVFE